eukprot:4362717-Pleurochrysis_carterae.AAC.1
MRRTSNAAPRVAPLAVSLVSPSRVVAASIQCNLSTLRQPSIICTAALLPLLRSHSHTHAGATWAA